MRYCVEAHVDLDAVVRGAGEEDCHAVVPMQAIVARACHVEQQSESTLVREHSMPVGSGRVFMRFSSNYGTNVLHNGSSSMH